MGSPVSPVEVCNLSLDLLRHNQLVTNITDKPETEEEALGSRWYDATRRSVLRMFPWNFARKRATISRVSAAPEFEYSDAYQLPNDFITPVFFGEDPVTGDTDYVVEGRLLLINNSGASSLECVYIRDAQEVVRFDPIFLMLLVAELAVVFGNSITGLNKSISGMEKLRDRWEAKARAKNGQENKPRMRYKSPLLTKRRGARRSGATDGQHLFS